MHISEELVRELQKRIDVSYEEAEYYLKRTKGDINMAVFLIMKKRNSSWERFKASLWDAMKYRFILTRKGEIIINLPLALLALFLLLYGIERHIFPLIVIFVIILVTECEVRIEKQAWSDEPKTKKNFYHYKKPTNETNQTYSRQKEEPDNRDTPTEPEVSVQTKQENVPNSQEAHIDREVKVKPEPNQKTSKENIKQEVFNAEQTKPTEVSLNKINEADDDYYEIVIEE